MIDTDNLLVARDHAGLHGGDSRFVGDDAPIGDFRGAHAAAQRAAWFIFADDTEGLYLRAQCGQIRGNIAGAAETFTLLDEIHNRNGCFGR